MGYTVKFKAGPKYVGLTTLIPGHIYEDDKGKEIIFVGYGEMSRNLKLDDEPPLWDVFWAVSEHFLYIKKAELDKFLNKGLISADLTQCKESSVLTRMFYFSKRPRSLIRDLGKYMPDDCFEHFKSTVLTPCNGGLGVFEENLEVEVKPGTYFPTKKMEVTIAT